MMRFVIHAVINMVLYFNFAFACLIDEQTSECRRYPPTIRGRPSWLVKGHNKSDRGSYGRWNFWQDDQRRSEQWASFLDWRYWRRGASRNVSIHVSNSFWQCFNFVLFILAFAFALLSVGITLMGKTHFFKCFRRQRRVPKLWSRHTLSWLLNRRMLNHVL